ncbi:MAG TPA: hypothetical protein PLX49_10670 [Prolixibacteraceae bacterium]|mgnify:FL=1|nr:hypothetical protein [Prolixibacteraceae bacterium]
MKITLTNEQVNSLVETEVAKRVGEYQESYRRELEKLQAQLNEMQATVSALMGAEIKVVKKKKTTNEEFVAMFENGMTNAQIAKETGYNPSYISLKRKNLFKKD